LVTVFSSSVVRTVFRFPAVTFEVFEIWACSMIVKHKQLKSKSIVFMVLVFEFKEMLEQ
jgi:hypothetical protein